MKISEKFVKVDGTINVSLCDNGFVVEASGLDKSDEWTTYKVVCYDVDEVASIIAEASRLERS